MSKSLLYIFLIFLGYNASAQPTSPGTAERTYKISGTVVDGQSGELLEYATVSLLQESDSSVVTGGISDPQGKFTITTEPGDYIVQVQFISYTSKSFNVTLDEENHAVDLGRITLSPDAETLDEVVVQGQKSQMIMELDKRVFNVGQDLANIGGNASDILDNLPSVNVDLEGNVSLRGSNNVRILINGKPSGLVGLSSTDALRQLDGSLIEKIEVITNPSARYEAQGNAGIINIVLKKDQQNGLNGSFNLDAGYPANYGLSSNLNLRRKWINLFLNYGIDYRSNPGSGYSNQEFFTDDTTYFTNLDRKRTRSGLSHNFRLGADFFLNKLTTITVSGLYQISDEDNDTRIRYLDYDGNRELVSNTVRYDNEKEDDEDIEFAFNLTREFKRENQKLTADVQYRESNEVEDSDQRQGPKPENGETFTPDLFQQTLNDEFESSLLLKSDYVHPFSEDSKFETGYRGSFRNTDNDYIVEEMNDDGVFVNLPGFTNDLKYRENITAFYAIYGNKHSNFTYQLGLRTEISDIRIEQEATSSVSKKNYTDFFPSAHVTYELPEKNSVQASYSRRLDRPGFWYLNPFSSFTDPRNIRNGNPDLDPEYTDSYEIGYLKNWPAASLFTSVYYRHTTGVIDRIQYVQDSITYTTPQNLNSRNAYGVELTFNKDIGDWWKINGSANFYRQLTDGSFGEQDLSSDSYTMSTRITSQMTLWKAYNFQISGRYSAPENDTQGRRKAYYTIDVGLNRDIWNKKGTITLNVRDVLNSRKYRAETFGNNFFQESEFQWRSRQVTLTLSYRLKQQKKKETQRKGEGNDFGNDEDF